MADIWTPTNQHLIRVGELYWKQSGKTFKGCLASGFAGDRSSAVSVFTAAELTTVGYVRGNVLVGATAVNTAFASTFDSGQNRAEGSQINVTITAGANALTYNCFFIFNTTDNEIALFALESSPQTIPATKSKQFLINYNLGGNTVDLEAP